MAKRDVSILVKRTPVQFDRTPDLDECVLACHSLDLEDLSFIEYLRSL